MFSLTVRDHMMIAHSFSSDVFGPAQRLHGATYIVDVTFMRRELDKNDLVIDIGLASEVLKTILAQFTLTNLDERDDLKGHNTTTEFMAKVVFDQLSQAIRKGELGAGASDLCGMRVTLSESHIAWATYEADL